jgi:hypothetical protein
LYKRRLVYFKWVAAASVLLSIGMGLYIWSGRLDTVHTDGTVGLQRLDIEKQETTGPQAATAEGGTKDLELGEGAVAGRRRDSGASALQPGVAEGRQIFPADGATPGSIASSVVLAHQDEDAADESMASPSVIHDRLHRDMHRSVPAADRRWETQAAITSLPMPVHQVYRTPTMLPRRVQEDMGLELLAGLSFSTGRFDPGYETSGGTVFQPPALASFETLSYRDVSDNMADNTTQLSGESYAPAVSFSYGMSLGARVAGNWIIQTGINYLYANSWARTSAFYQDPATRQKTAVLRPINYSTEGVVQVVQTDQVQLKNAFEFVSVPVKAGYIVLDRAVNLAFLAGVSADFLVENSITDQNGVLTDFSTGTGEGSPYRSTYYNASVGTALGAVIAGRYHLSIEPGYRLALSDFTKDNFSLNSRPNAFYVSFGINYRFR